MNWIEDTSWAGAVNEFWFNELQPRDWFGGAPRIDALIRERFGALRENLKHYPPSAELLDSMSLLAAVIVFDQFSRNIYRESAEAYSTDSLALALACHAVDDAMDAPLVPQQRHFLYMPFMHSENEEMQVRSIELFRALGDAELMRYAEHHKSVIERFGRFPSRNAVLRRQSTHAEEAFLLGERSKRQS